MASELVTFNVSGKIYTVLREPTLSLHPDSLLTQLAEEKKDETEIFVEGDQDLFKYVLEYHRDRKIILSALVPREAVIRELKRFGLDVEPDAIVVENLNLTSIRSLVDAEQRKLRKTREEKAAELFVAFAGEAFLAKIMQHSCGTISITELEMRERLIGMNQQQPEQKVIALFDQLLTYDQEHFESSMKAWLSSVGLSSSVTWKEEPHQSWYPVSVPPSGNIFGAVPAKAVPQAKASPLGGFGFASFQNRKQWIVSAPA